MATFFDKHKATLDKAIETIHGRGYWSAYPEMPSGKIYGETAKADQEAAFKDLLGKPFDLDQPTTGATVGHEVSPSASTSVSAIPARRPTWPSMRRARR